MTNSYGTVDYVANPGANLKAQQQFTVSNGQAAWSADTNAVAVSGMTVVIYQGAKYFGIAMDVNEGGGSKSDFDIPQLMVWAGPSTNVTNVAGTSTALPSPNQSLSQLNDNSANSGLTLIYKQNITPQIGTGSVPYASDPSRMVGNNSQTGSSGVDIAILVPISVLNGLSTNSKIYIGVQTGSLDDGGPEQIGFIDPSNLTAGGWLATNTTVTNSYFQANTTINASSAPLSFTTTSGQNYSNSGATGANQTLIGALTASKGEGTVAVLNPASQNSTLTFDSLTRSGTGTANFTTPDVVNNKITFSVAPAAAGTLISTGIFLNGANYGVYDSTGYLRALNYTSDTNVATTTGGATFGSVTGKNLLMTGAITAQTSVSLSTLKMSGDNALTLGASQTLTTNGILKTGGTGTTISGGAGASIVAGSGQDLVIRVDASTDNLTINTAIGANGSNRLVKSGAGNLNLNGAATYTGTTAVNAGALTVNSTVNGTSTIEIENTGTLAGTGTIGASGAQTNLRAGGAISPGTNGGTGVGVLSLVGNLASTATSSINLQLATDGFNASAMNSNGTVNTTLLGNTANRVAGANDRLNVGGTITLSSGTAMNVSLTGGYTIRAGDAFDLVDWGTTFTPNGFTYGSGLRTGSAAENSGFDLKLPDLASSTTGLYWDMSQFSSSGIIVAVPEPSRALMAGAGVAAMTLRRRRCPASEAA